MSFEGNDFGIRLRSLRNARGQTQTDFAKVLGIPQPTLSAYEGGRIIPTVDAIMNIAEKCNVSMDWLCGIKNASRITNLGDVYSFFVELYETKEFNIVTNIHDRVDIEDYKSKDDSRRNWIELKVYCNEQYIHPEYSLNFDLYKAIKSAHNSSIKLRRYECSQNNYEIEKNLLAEHLSDILLTKIDHSDLSEDERHKKMWEILNAEMKEKNNL